MDPSIERAIAERARTQLGLITTHQLHDIGLSASTLTRRTDSGLLIPAGGSTYRLASAPLTDEARVLAGCLDLRGTRRTSRGSGCTSSRRRRRRST